MSMKKESTCIPDAVYLDSDGAGLDYRFSVTNIPKFDLSIASNSRKKTRNASILLARF